MEPNATGIENDATRSFDLERVASAARFDGYSDIHKAMRLCMCQTTTRVGSTDPGDGDELRSTLAQVHYLLDLCQSHIKHENEFIQPALERARPGSTRQLELEHAEHREAIDNLRDLVGLVADSNDDMRAATLARLYRALSLFVASNFEHMHVEETDHNAVLWASYTDAELLCIQAKLVASMTEEEKIGTLHWFMPALAAAERANMCRSMQLAMPPELFHRILDVARRTTSAHDFAKLRRSLGLPPS